MTGARSRVLAALAAIAIWLVGLSSPTGAYPRHGRTVIASVGSSGAQQQRPATSLPTCFQNQVDISANGRFVAFPSSAQNLVANDTNRSCDVFRHDRLTRKTIRISQAPNGTNALGACPYGDPPNNFPDFGSDSPSISADGRFIAFLSCATNLVPGDTNLAADTFVHDAVRGETVRASVASDGSQSVSLNPTQRNYYYRNTSISDDGRYVGFDSFAPNLVADDTNGQVDAFVHDLRTGKTVRVSLTSDGRQLDGGLDVAGAGPSINEDGRYVAFESFSDELAPATGKGNRQIYVRDMRTGKVEIVSVSGQGDPGGPKPFMDTSQLLGSGGISADGRFVAFGSFASNLVPNDGNQLAPGTPTGVDIFVHDRQTGRTERVSVTSSGEEVRFEPTQPIVNFLSGGISGNGRFVSFGIANRGYSREPSSMTEVYVYDRSTGYVDWVSVDPDFRASSVAAESNCFSTTFPGSLSFSGRYAVFWGCPDNLVEGDANGSEDAFARDRGPDLGVGRATAGPVRLASDPTFSSTGLVLRTDAADELGEIERRQGGEIIGASLALRPRYENLYSAIELAYMPPLALATPGLIHGLRISVEEKHFEVRVSSLAGGTFELFDCTDAHLGCAKIADLVGGYGTTGMRIVFSLPLDRIGLEAGGQIADVEAFSSLGSHNGGVSEASDLDVIVID